MITEHWHDRRVLLLEAMLTRADQLSPTPDTGDLRSDMRLFTQRVVAIAETDQGRKWFHRMLPSGRDTDFTEVMSDFWRARVNSVAPMLQNAARRGEIRPGVDLGIAVEMMSAALYFDVIFYNRPVRPDYADGALDIFLNGVRDTLIRDAALAENLASRERMRALLRATTDAMIDPIALVEAVRDDDGQVADFTFREANPAACAYLRRRREDLLGAGMIETAPNVVSSGLFARYVDCVQTGDPVIVEELEYFSRSHREPRWYDVRGARAGTDRLSLTWRDVTDRSRARHGDSGGGRGDD